MNSLAYKFFHPSFIILGALVVVAVMPAAFFHITLFIKDTFIGVQPLQYHCRGQHNQIHFGFGKHHLIEILQLDTISLCPVLLIRLSFTRCCESQLRYKYT